jgi:hypothetical protein
MPALPAAPPPLVQSWADHEHAWRAAADGVEATSDGGRHWRVVLKTPGVRWLTRTSPSVGIVGVGVVVVVTKDGGRHWFPVSGFSATSVVGRGDLLYLADGAELRQAVRWPPARVSDGMTIPTRHPYTIDGNRSLRLRYLVSGGVAAFVLDGTTPVEQFFYRDWIMDVEPLDRPPAPLTSAARTGGSSSLSSPAAPRSTC